MNEAALTTDRWKSFVLVLTLINTIFAALLSGLQVDTGIRANNSNRDSQYYAVLASNELVRQGYQSAYDFQTLTSAMKYSQESLVMEFTALGLEQNGDKTGSVNSHLQSVIAKARAITTQKFSIMYTDPRYAPDQPDGIPNAQAYVDDQAKIANEIVNKQNAASDEYQKWNKKSDAYVAVLTLLAIVFFLLGVAQSTQRMRPFFAFSALFIMLIAGAWSFLIFIG
jgi:hypothetical protein